MLKLSTRIGIIAVILVVSLLISSMFITAQSPTSSPGATVTATTTVTVTPVPSPGQNTPIIESYTVEISQADDDDNNTMADVKLTVNLRNFELNTETPEIGSGGTPQGLIKYCMDQMVAVPMPSAEPGMSPNPVPSPNELASPVEPLFMVTPTPFPVGMCILSRDDSFTFRSIPIGVHTFMAELVQADGSLMGPRIFINTTIMVIPPP